MLTIKFKTCCGKDDEEYCYHFSRRAAVALYHREEGIFTIDAVLGYAVKRIFGNRAFYMRNHEIRGYGQIFRSLGNGTSSVTGRVQLNYLINKREVSESDAWAEFERLANQKIYLEDFLVDI